MKKGSLCLLFALILCLSVLLISCDQNTGAAETSDTAGTSAGSESEGILEAETEPPMVAHEMHDYLIYIDENAPVGSTAIQLEGECVDYDADHNLAVMKEEDVDVYNNLVVKYKVYDLVSGDVIFEKEHSSPYYYNQIPEYGTRSTMSVDIVYPVIRVKITNTAQYSDGTKTTYDVSYYAAKKGGELIHNTTDNSLQMEINKGDNLYALTLGDEVFWLDKNIDIIRSADKIATSDGYDFQYFNAEYQGYLYSWSYNRLQIFNRAGLCTIDYTADDDSSIECFLLNDGNVLLQKVKESDIYSSYDFILNGYRYDLTHYIVNSVTGEMAEIELDFIVRDLKSAYSEEVFVEEALGAGRVFTLAPGRDNKAIVYRIANGVIAKDQTYVVLDNQMNIEYALKNDTPVIMYDIDLPAATHNLYVATVKSGGVECYQVFDLDGNYVCSYNSEAPMTDKFFVTEDKIYDHKMNVVYDLNANNYSRLRVAGDNIFLQKTNFATGAVEVYIFNGKDSIELLADGVNTKFVGGVSCGYLLQNADTGVYSIYANDKTELWSGISAPTITICEDVVLVRAVFNGKTLAYVIK
ncbi:MAG: hypothetical protein ACI3X1_02350 [Eubacteriales bacterium]